MSAKALFCALCILSALPTYAADDLQPAQFSESNYVQVSTHMQRAEKAMAAGDDETAFAEYRAALDEEHDQHDSASLRQSALDGFTKAGTRLFDQRIAEARWQDAEDIVRTILKPEYNLGDKTAQRLLQQLENPSYYNKTITPEFVYQVQVIKSLLHSADGLMDSGRYDEAKKTLDSILKMDPYNTAAWRGIEEINKAKRQVADIARRAAAPLMRTHTAKSGEWLPLVVLGAFALISFALIFKGLFGSTSATGSDNNENGPSTLFPLGWFVLAIALLAFIAVATRYEVIFTPDQNGQSVLKVDRWTGSVEWLVD